MGDIASDERVLRHLDSPVRRGGGASMVQVVERLDRDAALVRLGEGSVEAQRMDHARPRVEHSS